MGTMYQMIASFLVLQTTTPTHDPVSHCINTVVIHCLRKRLAKNSHCPAATTGSITTAIGYGLNLSYYSMRNQHFRCHTNRIYRRTKHNYLAEEVRSVRSSGSDKNSTKTMPNTDDLSSRFLH